VPVLQRHASAATWPTFLVKGAESAVSAAQSGHAPYNIRRLDRLQHALAAGRVPRARARANCGGDWRTRDAEASKPQHSWCSMNGSEAGELRVHLKTCVRPPWSTLLQRMLREKGLPRTQHVPAVPSVWTSTAAAMPSSVGARPFPWSADGLEALYPSTPSTSQKMCCESTSALASSD